MTPRIGHGIDAHRFIPGRPLMLGGVLVPYSRGLLGHSDGDAVVHALAEEPRLAAHLGPMSDAMSNALGLEPGTIAVGATTTDGMGFSGRSEGIAASATVLLERR